MAKEKANEVNEVKAAAIAKLEKWIEMGQPSGLISVTTDDLLKIIEAVK